MQSMDLIETYAYRRSKNPASDKEEIKCNNIIKQYKKWGTLMLLQKKRLWNMIEIDYTFLIINTEYQ